MKTTIKLSLAAISVAAMLCISGCRKEESTEAEAAYSSEENISMKKPSQAVPFLSATSATQVSIRLQVCAGSTGATAGFSVQWVRRADYDLTGWNANVCEAGFSGNAHLSNYNLPAGGCVTIDIGELLLDEGASATCTSGLNCSTEYVFRAFAHASSTRNKSAFTPTLLASTLACSNPVNCTFTQGYWKTHYPGGELPSVDVAWPVSSLTLGTINYTIPELISVMNTPPGSNGLIALADQLIAAKLNIANGADPTDVAAAIAAADALIGGLIIPPVGAGFLDPSATNELWWTLMNYNAGETGPGHCP
jgi:hypothetical protein